MVSEMSLRICIAWLVTDRVLQKLGASRDVLDPFRRYNEVSEAKEVKIEVNSEHSEP